MHKYFLTDEWLKVRQVSQLTWLNFVERFLAERFQIQFLIEAGHLDDATFLDGITQPIAAVVVGTARKRRFPEQVEAAFVVMLRQHHALGRTLEKKHCAPSKNPFVDKFEENSSLEASVNIWAPREVLTRKYLRLENHKTPCYIKPNLTTSSRAVFFMPFACGKRSGSL